MRWLRVTPSISDWLSIPWQICVIFTATRLEIFTILSDKSLNDAKIAHECGAQVHLLKPLLNACVAMGFLDCQNGIYTNTDISRAHFTKGQPLYAGDFIKLLYNEFHRWYNLYDVIIDQNAPPETEQSEFYKAETFIRAMNNIGMLGEAEALKNTVDFSDCNHMVDAGGGSGLYSIVLCRKYPRLHSTILDFKETLTITREMMASHNEKDRIQLKAADINKTSFGGNMDVVLLSDVLYDEALAGPILQNAWNCLRPNGLLVIRGYYADPHAMQPLFATLFVLNMLTFNPNRKVITAQSLPIIVREAGFTITKHASLTERSRILIAIKKETENE